MAFDAEKTAKALQTRLRTRLASALDVVEATWITEGDPIALPEPVTWFFGHKPTVLEMDSVAFPFMAVVVAERMPQARPARWGYQEQDLNLFTDFFVVATDETTVNKIACRYTEAICAVLQEEQYINAYMQADWEPEVHLSEASRHAAKQMAADMFTEADVDFIQGGRIIVKLEGS